MSITKSMTPYFIFVFAGIIFFHTQASFIRPTDDPKELILYAFLTLFGIAFLFKKTKEENQAARPDVNILTLAFSLYLSFMVFNFYWVADSIYEGLVVTARIFLMVVCASFLSRMDREKLVFFFKILVFLALITVVFKKQMRGGLFLPVGHVSYYSDFLVLLLPWGGYFMFSEKKPILKIFFGLVLFLFLLEIFSLGRKTSFVGMGLSALFFLCLAIFYFKVPAKKILIFFTLGLFACGVLLATERFWRERSLSPESTVERLIKFARHLSTAEGLKSEGRMEILTRTLYGIKERPLMGWGYGSFKFVYPQFYKPGDSQLGIFNVSKPEWLMHPHNEILNQLFEGGSIGLMLFLIPLVLFFVFLLKKLIKKGSADEKLLGITLLSGFVLFSASFLFNTSITNPVIRMELILYMALSYLLIKNDLPSRNFSKRSPIFHPFMASSLLTNVIPAKAGIHKYLKLLDPDFRRDDKKCLCQQTAKGFLFILFLGAGYLTVGSSLSSYLLMGAKNEYRTNGVTTKHLWASYLSPGSYYTLLQAGRLEQKMNHLEKAESFYLKAHQSFPYVPQTSLELAKLYREEGKLESARKILKPSAERYPFYKPIRHLLNDIEEDHRTLP